MQNVPTNNIPMNLLETVCTLLQICFSCDQLSSLINPSYASRCYVYKNYQNITDINETIKEKNRFLRTNEIKFKIVFLRIQFSQQCSHLLAFYK